MRLNKKLAYQILPIMLLLVAIAAVCTFLLLKPDSKRTASELIYTYDETGEDPKISSVKRVIWENYIGDLYMVIGRTSFNSPKDLNTAQLLLYCTRRMKAEGVHLDETVRKHQPSGIETAMWYVVPDSLFQSYAAKYFNLSGGIADDRSGEGDTYIREGEYYLVFSSIVDIVLDSSQFNRRTGYNKDDYVLDAVNITKKENELIYDVICSYYLHRRSDGSFYITGAKRFNVSGSELSDSVTSHSETSAEHEVLPSVAGSEQYDSSLVVMPWKEGILAYRIRYNTLSVEYIEDASVSSDTLRKTIDLNTLGIDGPLEGVIMDGGNQLLFLTESCYFPLDEKFNPGKKMDLSAFQISDIRENPYCIIPDRNLIIYTKDDGVYISPITNYNPECLYANEKTDSNVHAMSFTNYSVGGLADSGKTVCIRQWGYETLNSLILYNTETGKDMTVDIQYQTGGGPVASGSRYMVSFINERNAGWILQVADFRSGETRKIPFSLPGYLPSGVIAINMDSMYYFRDNQLYRLSLDSLTHYPVNITVKNQDNVRISGANNSGDMLLIWDGAYKLVKIPEDEGRIMDREINKIQDILLKTDISHKNFDQLKEISPDYFLLAWAARYQIENEIKPGVPDGKYNFNIVTMDAVSAAAKEIYGDQVEIRYEPRTDAGMVLDIDYYPEDDVFEFKSTGGIHRLIPYVLEYSKNGDSIKAKICFVRYSGEYNHYLGPYYDENGQEIGVLEVQNNPLTLEQVKKIQDKLPVREYELKERTDGSVWVKSCRMVN